MSDYGVPNGCYIPVDMLKCLPFDCQSFLNGHLRFGGLTVEHRVFKGLTTISPQYIFKVCFLSTYLEHLAVGNDFIDSTQPKVNVVLWSMGVSPFA